MKCQTIPDYRLRYLRLADDCRPLLDLTGLGQLGVIPKEASKGPNTLECQVPVYQVVAMQGLPSLRTPVRLVTVAYINRATRPRQNRMGIQCLSQVLNQRGNGRLQCVPIFVLLLLGLMQ